MTLPAVARAARRLGARTELNNVEHAACRGISRLALHLYRPYRTLSVMMKRVFAGLSLACLALAIPFYSSESPNGQVQLQFSVEDYANYPGYDLDLNDLRLVQLEGREPVWMTEYEKVRLTVG